MNRESARIVLASLLLMAAAPALAGWVRTAATEDDDVVYIDPATIRKMGSLRQVWVIQDLKKKGSAGERSRKVHWEYDCAERKYRGLSMASHAGTMASGKILKSVEAPGDWIDVAPETVDAAILGAVCAPVSSPQ